MRQVYRWMVVGCVLLASGFSLNATRADEVNLQALAGEWVYVSGKRAGKDVEKSSLEGVVTFRDKQVTIPAGPDDQFVMKFTLDTEKKPVTIDLEISGGPFAGAPAKGIVKIDEGQLTICYDSTAAKRPEKFETTEENGFFMFTLKRKPTQE